MQEKNQNPSQNSNASNYNPTARNFDQTDVSGQAKSINNIHQQSPERQDETSDDSDPALMEQDLEETGLSDKEADQVEWDSPQQEEKNTYRQRGNEPNATSK